MRQQSRVAKLAPLRVILARAIRQSNSFPAKIQNRAIYFELKFINHG